MSYFKPDELAQLNASPGFIYTLYSQHWYQFTKDLGPVDQGMVLGGSILPVVFSAIAAFDLKAYGPEPSDVSLAAIIASPTLACDGYVRLAWYFTGYLPQIKWPPPAKIVALGWNNGIVGNHAQMMVSDGLNTLLLDPTVGVVARIGYDALLQGKPPTAIQSFWAYNSGRPLFTFEETVVNAILQGKYRPGDAMYYATSLTDYNTLPAMSEWQTPAPSGPLIR